MITVLADDAGQNWRGGQAGDAPDTIRASEVPVLRRLYVDNFRSLVNFELKLGQVNLLMGGNGSGKSSVFAALTALRRIVQGERIGEVLAPASCTRWQTRPVQVFELDIIGGGTSFNYHLEAVHRNGRVQIQKETLTVMFDDGTVHRAAVYDRNGDKAMLLAPGQKNFEALLVDVERSALSLVIGRPGNERAAEFVARMRRVYMLAINPAAMRGWSEGEDAAPAADLANFASWYRHLIQDRGPEMDEAREALRGVLDGFLGLRLRDSGHHEAGRKLVSEWKLGEGTRTSFDFTELSDGQRALIGLYTLLYAHGEEDTTIGVDEPDNFVALPEIQPWLGALSERPTLQTLLISHHPEVLNMHAQETGLVFRRDDGGPTRVERFAAAEDEDLSPAELVARGWYRGAP